MNTLLLLLACKNNAEIFDNNKSDQKNRKTPCLDHKLNSKESDSFVLISTPALDVQLCIGTRKPFLGVLELFYENEL